MPVVYLINNLVNKSQKILKSVHNFPRTTRHYASLTNFNVSIPKMLIFKMDINTCIWIYIYLRSSRATCGCGRWGLGGAVRCYVYMWSWSLNTLKYGYRPSGSWAGLKKQETRLIKKRGNQGPIQRVCMGAGGRGWDPFNLALRHRVPLPSSSPDPYELDPGEQCKRGGRVKREKGVKGGRGGGG